MPSTEFSTTTAVPMLHFLCGKIGSGKSTLAVRLAAQPRTLLISEDSWLAALYPGEIVNVADYGRCANRLRNAMGSHVAALVSAGLSVVLDFPANTLRSREWLRTVAEEAGCAHTLHYLDVPDAVCKARLAARNMSGSHPFTTSEEEYDAITAYFVEPDEREGLVIVRHAWEDSALMESFQRN
ncbi:ATP-binding protein [Bordetella sp. N]|uniref:AAA family ATPase n=1 Tax=Bordetella sp. N TaxID=1746199 RepID=UPI00070DE353|nr:ATP-binding protein [Bordetella sp. N]ALM83376.1 cell division protein ZipA [Bordetella sp. N]